MAADQPAAERPSAPDAEQSKRPESDRPPAPDPDEATATADDAKVPKKKGGVGRVTKIVFGLSIVIFIWYLLADRFTPYTDQARVDGFVVPIVPWVSGYVTSVDVRLHDVVEAGDVIVQIDRRPYELALRQAQAQLDVATQNVGAQGAGVQSAAARVGVSRATLDRAQRTFDRVQTIHEQNPGALSQADRDAAETGLDQARERLLSSEADLESARERLGVTGEGNPNIQAAIAAVEKAQLDLEFTTVRSASHGGIENFRIDVGYFAGAGQPIGTFVSTADVWIQADLRENNLEHIEPGDRVEFVLDAAPGRVFGGEVRTVGFGVAEGLEGSRGSLQTVSESKGWLRDPQRFPVIIGIDDPEARFLLRAGAQANVIVYTGGHPILGAIARFRIRLVSWLSFVR